MFNHFFNTPIQPKFAQVNNQCPHVDISSFFLIFSTFPFFLRVAPSPFLISGGPKYSPHPSFHAHTADFSPSAHVCQNELRVASVACQCGSQLQPGTVVANHFYQSLFSPCIPSDTLRTTQHPPCATFSLPILHIAAVESRAVYSAARAAHRLCWRAPCTTTL